MNKKNDLNLEACALILQARNGVPAAVQLGRMEGEERGMVPATGGVTVGWRGSWLWTRLEEWSHTTTATEI